MAKEEKIERERDRITISISPELREKIGVVAEMMGLSEAAAARYLMIRGMEGVLHVLSSTQSANALRSMFDAFEREMEPESPKNKGRKGGAAVVRVRSNTRTKAQKSTLQGVFDLPSSTGRKQK